MKKFKKIIDERQEMELYKIEHIFFWIVYWLLLASIIIQATFMNAPFSNWAFEWFIFMIGSIGLGIGSYRKGQWDYYTKPTLKSYLLYSLIGAGAFSLIFTIAQYFTNEYLKNSILSLLIFALVLFVFLFILMFSLLSLLGHLTKKRQAKLAQEFADDDDEN